MRIDVSSICLQELENLVIPVELGRNLRRSDDFIKLAVVTAHEILRSKDVDAVGRGDTFGLIIGTAYGTMQTNFDVLDAVVFGLQTSPTLFSHSVFNAAAGYASAVLNLRGCALTITDFVFPFFRALQEGCLAIEAGRLTRCLVFQIETYSELLDFARKKETVEPAAWNAGAVCWLLEKGTVGKNPLARIDKIVITDAGYDPADSLHYCEQVQFDGNTSIGRDPLAVPQLISRAVLEGGAQRIREYKAEGSWGKVLLYLS